jgi:glycyl-tRNA synthetase beta chain
VSKPSQTLLVELGTEELPSSALQQMVAALARALEAGCGDHNLSHSGTHVFATPRRLAVVIDGLTLEAPDQEQEVLGPPVAAAKNAEGEWTPAALGFARKQGVGVEALQELNSDKGTRLGVRRQVVGARAEVVLPEIIAKAIEAIPVSKRMRWGRQRHEFLRPVQWLVALLGSDIIPVETLGLSSGRATRGHRFHHPEPIVLAEANDYEGSLRQAKVMANFTERRENIRSQVAALAAEVGGAIDADDTLLDEVTGLVEWPVALRGSFDPAFLSVPAGALISSMREHQKYFHLVDDKGALMPAFITVANIESLRPELVVEGNEKVIQPRLADAAFFYDTDKATPLVQRSERLSGVVFQQQLGTLADKSRRVQALATGLARLLGADVAICSRAASLCKNDLVSDLVLEFPDLQGIAGAHYARHDGEPDGVADAIEQHYWPRQAGDPLPRTTEAAVVALADRLDTLVGIFGIGQTPSGSKDPFGLRRAALAIIRLLIDQDVTLGIDSLVKLAAEGFGDGVLDPNSGSVVTEFILERFPAWYEEQGISIDVLRAVLAVGASSAADINRRVHAVHGFIGSDAAVALAAANKRVANILNKAGGDFSGRPDPALFTTDAEKQLFASLEEAVQRADKWVDTQAYAEALEALATLRTPVDQFFEEVMVNAEEPAIRINRHELLAGLRAAFTGIADLALLAGGRG